MTKPKPATARGYFRALIDRTHASATTTVYHLRTLRAMTSLDTEKLMRLFYAGFNSERGLERLRLSERYINAASRDVVKVPHLAPCTSWHSAVIRSWRELCVQLFSESQNLKNHRPTNLKYSPWRLLRHDTGMVDLMHWFTEDMPLDDLPAQLHRERHGAEVALGSQIFDEADNRLAAIASDHWGAVELRVCTEALQRGLMCLGWLGDATPAQRKQVWSAMDVCLLPMSMQQQPHYMIPMSVSSIGSWVIDVEQTHQVIADRPIPEIGPYHAALMTRVDKWLVELHERCKWPLQKTLTKPIGESLMWLAMDLEPLPTISDLEREFAERLGQDESATGSLVRSSDPVPISEMSEFRSPFEWRRVLEECGMPSTKSSWRRYRDDFKAEEHPTAKSRLYRFPKAELLRAGIKVHELQNSFETP